MVMADAFPPFPFILLLLFEERVVEDKNADIRVLASAETPLSLQSLLHVKGAVAPPVWQGTLILAKLMKHVLADSAMQRTVEAGLGFHHIENVSWRVQLVQNRRQAELSCCLGLTFQQMCVGGRRISGLPLDRRSACSPKLWIR